MEGVWRERGGGDKSPLIKAMSAALGPESQSAHNTTPREKGQQLCCVSVCVAAAKCAICSR